MNSVSEKRRVDYRLAGRDPSEFADHVLLDICTGCGASCVYCLHQAAGLVESKLMTEDVFYAIADVLQREGYELVYLYQSGESMLHPKFPDFVAAISERGMNSSTATKLFMPIDFDRLSAALDRCDVTGQTVEFLITVDALDQEVQSKIGPGIRTDRVKANLREMAALQGKHPCMRCLLDTVVNAHNEDHIDEMAAYLRELGFARWFPKRMGYFMPSFARPEDLAAIAEAVPRSGENPARFSIVDGTLIPSEKQNRCDLGAPGVSPEGDVTVCCHDMLHRHRLGNIVQAGSLRKIMASETFQSAASKGRRMGLDICRGCN